MDYDRRLDDQKPLPVQSARPGRPARFRPDLVVHQRGSVNSNLLVIEWRKTSNQRRLELMRERLKLLTLPPPESYGYQLGVLIVQSSDKCCIESYYVDGNQTDLDTGPCHHLPSER
jgi:hypothetical protein